MKYARTLPPFPIAPPEAHSPRIDATGFGDQRKRRPILPLLIGLVLTSRAAHADPSTGEQAAARQLFDDAQKEIDGGKVEAACTKYAESNRLDPHLGTLLHLADCYEKSGKTASAWVSFRHAYEVAARTPNEEKRAALAKARAEQLETKLSRLTVDVVPQDGVDVEVQEDGSPVDRAAWGTALPVDRGTHSVSARAPGYKPWSTSVMLTGDGASAKVTVPSLERMPAESQSAPALPVVAAVAPAAAAPAALVVAPTPSSPSEAASPGSAPPPSLDTHRGTAGSAQRVLGYAVGGLGLVGLGVGAVFGLQRNAKLDERNGVCSSQVHCTPADVARNDQLTDDAKSGATLATIGFVGGGIALATGFVLVFTAPASTSSAERAASMTLSPWMTSTCAGTTMGGRW
jgi:hypothetical protein